jgi:hypothetical protein
MKRYHRARLMALSFGSCIVGLTSLHAQTLPNPKLTPGSVRTTDANEICSHGTRELRLYNNDRARARERYVHVLRSYNDRARARERYVHVLRSYNDRGVGVHTSGMETPKHHQLDHLVPLGIGGADDESNLWPQPYDEAILKDKLEWRMRDLVCKENVRSPAQIEKLQQEIRTNWWDAYKKYVTQ